MSLESIIAEIDSEISRLQQAKLLLSDVVIKKGPGRPSGKARSAPSVAKAKRTISAAGRAKIAAAQKARWAKVKKSAGKAVSAKSEVAK